MESKESFAKISQSPNDKREYKIIKLNNQLTTLLISDPSNLQFFSLIIILDGDKSAASMNVHVGSCEDFQEVLNLDLSFVI